VERAQQKRTTLHRSAAPNGSETEIISFLTNGDIGEIWPIIINDRTDLNRLDTEVIYEKDESCQDKSSWIYCKRS
jgi:hypothetical protein